MYPFSLEFFINHKKCKKYRDKMLQQVILKKKSKGISRFPKTKKNREQRIAYDTAFNG